MYLNKKHLFILTFFLLSFNLFSQTLNINNLILNFERTEKNSSGEETSVKGTLYYSKNPYEFVFEVQEPKKEISFINNLGTFLLQDDEITPFEEGTKSLKQTQVDILTWFKNDYGLYNSGYAPISFEKEDEFVVTKWLPSPTNNIPIRKVRVYHNEKGIIVRLQMFLDNNKLSVDTSLSDFNYFLGYSYPQKIVSLIYDDNNNIQITNTLNFYDVQINKKYSPQYTEEKLKLMNVKQISAKQNTSSIQTVTDKNYSLFSTVINSGYTFYKSFITSQDTSNCPYTPTCSTFMLQAVSSYGPFGIIMGIERLKRCTVSEHKRDVYIVTENGKHYDPVPAKKKEG